MIKRLRKWIRRQRFKRALENLNATAAFFGYPPKNARAWLRASRRLGERARSFGISAEDLSNGCRRMTAALASAARYEEKVTQEVTQRKTP